MTAIKINSKKTTISSDNDEAIATTPKKVTCCDEVSGLGFFCKGFGGILTTGVQSFGKAKRFIIINVLISRFLEFAVYTDLY